MGSLRRGAARFSITVVATMGMAVPLTSVHADAAVVATAGGQTPSGDPYVIGPSNLIRKICPNGMEIGFVCLYTGLDESGKGVAIFRGNNAPPMKCDDVPLRIVRNVENDTNERIELGDGTCAHKGAVENPDIEPGVDTNVSPGMDPWISR